MSDPTPLLQLVLHHLVLAGGLYPAVFFGDTHRGGLSVTVKDFDSGQKKV